VVLAGYLRLVPAEVVRTYAGRIVNVHPALLPAFGGTGMYGARIHRAVLEAGVTVTGVTVHYVDEIFDHGRIIAQWPVPVLAGDTETALAERVLRVEHALYPRVVHRLALRIGAGDGNPPVFSISDPAAFTLSIGDERCLVDAIESALA
jgi:phosphoribosylglycinamide formyltransferase 1